MPVGHGRVSTREQNLDRQRDQLTAEPNRSMGSIAKLLGVSRSTLYAHLPQLTPSRAQ